MTSLIFALSLLAAPLAPDLPQANGAVTAGQIYDGCTRYAARTSTPVQLEDPGEATCAAIVAITQASAAAQAAAYDVAGEPDRRPFCQPQDFDDGEGTAIARIFIAYVDHNPASRELASGEVFDRALAEKWPCPH